MTDRRRSYVSYLVRLWRSGQGEKATWHASTECPLTGEQRNFTNLEALWAFLQQQIRDEEEENEAPHDTLEGGTK